MSIEKINLLKRKRASCRAAVTNIVTKLEAELSKTDDQINLSEIEECAETLTCKFESLQSVDLELEPLFTNEEFQQEFNKAEEYRDKVVIWKFRVQKKCEKLRVLSNARTVREHIDESGQLPVLRNAESKPVDKLRVKFPKLVISKFYGDISQWLTFWNSFESAVHNNESLDKVDKFNLLKAHLGGSALSTVEGFPISANTYDSAVALLKDRFAKPDLLIHTHMSKIMSLRAVKNSSDVCAFRNFYDTCSTHIRSLESLGLKADNYGSILCPMLLKLLPSDLVLEYNKLEIENGYSDVKQLIDFLSKALDARERASAMTHPVADCRRREAEVSPSRRAEPVKNDRSQKKKFTAAGLFATAKTKEEEKERCAFCGSEKHADSECGLTIEEKKQMLMRKGCCFRCLKAKHLSRFCKATVICSICGKRHNSLLCFEKEKGAEEKNLALTNGPENDGCGAPILLQTLIVKLQGRREGYVRALIDSGSQRSYVTKFAANTLGFVDLGKENVNHSLFGGTEKSEVHCRYRIKMSSLTGDYTCNFPVLDQAKICSNIPRVRYGKYVHELRKQKVFLTDMETQKVKLLFENSPEEVHVLIGSDVGGKLLTGKVAQLSCGLSCVQTRLGWTIMGRLPGKELNNSSMTVLSLHVNDAKISELWSLDSLGITDPAEKQTQRELEEATQSHFLSTVKRNNEGRYEVSLPWIENHPVLSDNRIAAEKRLNSCVKNLRKMNHLEEYENVFKEWKDEEIIEVIDSTEGSNCHYLPHRAVFRECSTTKIRPVFDASAQDKDGVSLNHCLAKGPNYIELIPSILNKFRLGTFGVVSDIRRAFLQISINPQDRDFLRFLWHEGGDSKNLITYRHKRVVFGLNVSPFLLAATLKYHLSQVPEHLKTVAEKLDESLYVDNCVTSVDTVEQLTDFIERSKDVMSSAGFNLRGWLSNEETVTPVQLDQKISVLGLAWDASHDTLSCFVKEDSSRPVTKRNILSSVHKIFDPVGFSAPVTLIPKMLLQECWKLGISWDQELPDSLSKKFEKWKNQLPILEAVRIPRRLLNCPMETSETTLHVFCDASKTAYATCIFLVSRHESSVTCRLVQCRAKVAPLKSVTIPRLELLACTIGARLLTTVKDDLKLEDVQVYFWSDSMDVIFWIKKLENWGTFVSNRVKEIRQLTDPEKWNHVSGVDNPADLPSRGCSAEVLAKSKWWEGPKWLTRPPEEWPVREIVPNMEVVNSEKKKTIVVATAMEGEEKYYHRYSSYVRLVRITAWLTRFWTNLKKEKSQRILGDLESEEIKKAELTLLKQVQMDAFSCENDKRLNSLQVIKDPDGIIRLKTRIFFRDDYPDFRLPIILPSNHPVVKALIVYRHEQLGHSGVQMLMNNLRENYWILKSRKTVKEVVNACIVCKRFSEKPVSVSEGLLPEDRVRDAAIFEIIGVDLAGPLILKGGSKAWILILTCAVFRAVHFELLTSLSTENFLLGLRRFIARRGKPFVIYSDNGTNFKGAYRLMEKIDLGKLKNLDELNPISWKFIPPNAPWWGGFWERLIGLMKRILRKTLGKSSLNYEEMNTVLCDCESLINSRPLTYVSDDIDDLVPLTPAMFLQDIREVGVPELDQIDEEKLRKRLAYRYRVQKDLRKRFRTEYLGQLREMRKVKKEVTLSEGDVVLVGEDHTKRQNWNLGRIEKLYPGKDNKVRVALVKTKFGSVLRPVQRLYLLELKGKNNLFQAPTNIPLLSDTNGGDSFPVNLERNPRQTDSSLLPCSSDPGSVPNSELTPLPLPSDNLAGGEQPDGPQLLEPRRSRYGRILKVRKL